MFAVGCYHGENAHRVSAVDDRLHAEARNAKNKNSHHVVIVTIAWKPRDVSMLALKRHHLTRLVFAHKVNWCLPEHSKRYLA